MNETQKMLILKHVIEQIKKIDLSFQSSLATNELQYGKVDEKLKGKIQHISDSINYKLEIIKEAKQLLEGVI